MYIGNLFQNDSEQGEARREHKVRELTTLNNYVINFIHMHDQISHDNFYLPQENWGAICSCGSGLFG